jgi:hypothetical protein
MTAAEHEQELADLYNFFQTATFPEIPFRLNKYMTVSGDPKNFVAMEIMRIERYQGADHVRDSLFKHLRELKAICLKAVE